MSAEGADRRVVRAAPAWSLGILAGGESRRMGRDKGTAPFLGTTLREHLARRLAPDGVPVLLSTGTRDDAAPAGWTRVLDAEGGLGPLAGVAALVGAARTKFVLIVACDAPLLPPDTGDRLLRYSTGVDAVLLSVGGRVEPFPALIATELAPRLRDLLASGVRRADGWHERCSAAYVPFATAFPGADPSRALLNANDPEALARAEAEALRETANGPTPGA